MTYGLNSRLFVQDGPTVHAASAAAERNSAPSGRWRKLDNERRLQAVERALQAPANDLIDGYPLAL